MTLNGKYRKLGDSCGPSLLPSSEKSSEKVSARRLFSRQVDEPSGRVFKTSDACSREGIQTRRVRRVDKRRNPIEATGIDRNSWRRHETARFKPGRTKQKRTGGGAELEESGGRRRTGLIVPRPAASFKIKSAKNVANRFADGLCGLARVRDSLLGRRPPSVVGTAFWLFCGGSDFSVARAPFFTPQKNQKNPSRGKFSWQHFAGSPCRDVD